MLLIKLPNGRWREWHLGSYYPLLSSEHKPVMEFQADGDELQALLQAIQERSR